MADIVYVVGLGPGDPQFLTAQAQSALEEAEVLCGYPVYLDLVRPYYPEKEYYATGMTKELDRCRWRWKLPTAAGPWLWCAAVTPECTAWPAPCWSWLKAART